MNNGACFYRDSMEVTFNRPLIDIGPDRNVCENAALVLDAGNQELDYTWQDGSKNSSFDVKAEGLYIVAASNRMCTVKDSVQVSYKPTPVFSLGEDKQFCKGEALVIGSHLTNSYNYLWEDGSTSAARMIHQPGTYQVTGFNECGSFTDEIIIRQGSCLLMVPNAFTPNGDGKNDIFKVSRTEQLASFSMQIFNRWGQQIFESRDQSQGWNGYLNGKICDIGSYPYLIQYRKTNEPPVTLKGIVLLIK